MLALIIPFIALLSKVHANDMKSEVSIDIITEGAAADYEWQDMTKYDKPEEENKLVFTDRIKGIARYDYYSLEDVREFQWKRGGDDAPWTKCSMWLDKNPGYPKVVYVLGSGAKRFTFSDTDAEELTGGDLSALQVTCEGDEEPISVPATASHLTKLDFPPVPTSDS